MPFLGAVSGNMIADQPALPSSTFSRWINDTAGAYPEMAVSLSGVLGAG